MYDAGMPHQPRSSSEPPAAAVDREHDQPVDARPRAMRGVLVGLALASLLWSAVLALIWRLFG
jgi:hypothetical protein